MNCAMEKAWMFRNRENNTDFPSCHFSFPLPAYPPRFKTILVKKFILYIAIL